jgi:hypothetical protein
MSMDNTRRDPALEPITLIGCGILAKELRYLIKKNNWAISLRLFDSSLHVDFNKLQNALEKGLAEKQDSRTVVFYGTCHPLMDKIIRKGKTIRTPGQNCVEILLGKEIFTRELEKGAFFLMEEWAQKFEYVTGMAFHDNPLMTRDIFQMEHAYLLGLRTPCSGDFVDNAEKVSRLVELPLRWMDVSLNRLEQTLEQTIEQRRLIP